MKIYGIIYKIINKADDKTYIGQTIDNKGFKGRYHAKGIGIERVYNFYLAQIKGNRHYNKHLFNAIEKYGFNSFEVIEEFDVAYSKEELDKKEIYWINFYKSYNKKFGYNVETGGKKGTTVPRKTGANHSNSIKVVCLTTGKIFECISEASIFYKCNCGHIVDSCKLNRKYCGKIDNIPLVWRYYDDYLNMTNKEILEVIIEADERIICLNTKEIFKNGLEAEKESNISSSNILKCCKGKQKTAGKDEKGNTLKWKYYRDYLKECA